MCLPPAAKGNDSLWNPHIGLPASKWQGFLYQYIGPALRIRAGTVRDEGTDRPGANSQSGPWYLGKRRPATSALATHMGILKGIIPLSRRRQTMWRSTAPVRQSPPPSRHPPPVRPARQALVGRLLKQKAGPGATVAPGPACVSCAGPTCGGWWYRRFGMCRNCRFCVEVGVPGNGGYVQSRMTLPDWPERMMSKPCSKSSMAKRWVMAGATSRPLWSMEAILYQVSNISRP